MTSATPDPSVFTPAQGTTAVGRADAVPRDGAHAVFGQVMGLVALTVGCAALGAYVGRNLTGGIGIVFFIGAFACIFGLNSAARAGREQLAIGLLRPGAGDLWCVYHLRFQPPASR